MLLACLISYNSIRLFFTDLLDVSVSWGHNEYNIVFSIVC